MESLKMLIYMIRGLAVCLGIAIISTFWINVNEAWFWRGMLFFALCGCGIVDGSCSKTLKGW